MKYLRTRNNIESSRGTRLEPRIHTRSRPVSNAIDAKLRDDLTRLKNEINKWGELACSIPQLMNVIEANHKAFLGNTRSIKLAFTQFRCLNPSSFKY